MLAPVVNCTKERVAVLEDDSKDIDEKFLGFDILACCPRLSLQGELTEVELRVFADGAEKGALLESTT